MYMLRSHSHGGPDQRFSQISAALAMNACMTLETFVHVVQHAYKPHPTMTLLIKSLDFHGWLEDAFSKHHSCISLPRQFVFSKNDSAESTDDGVKAMVKCSEWSNSVMGEPMFPLQRLPIQKPRWNANRPVFSKWETPKVRTTPEKSEEMFKKAEAQIFSKSGEYYDIPFDFQRDSWVTLLQRIRKWEKLEAKDFDGWWPMSNADVTSWVSSLTELPMTSDGEATKNALIFAI